MSDEKVHYLNKMSEQCHEGQSRHSPNQIQMCQDARNLAARADEDTGLSGYLILALQKDGSWQTAYMLPQGAGISRTMFAGFVKEAITRDISTADEIKYQLGEER